MLKKVQNIKELERGDIIRHNGSGNSYVITSVYGEYAIAVDTIHVSNPNEWSIVEKKHARENT